MNSSKELWQWLFEDFTQEMGREPTDNEMNEIYAAALSDQIEAAELRMMDDRKKGE